MARPANPVLIVNPRSGGGKAGRADLVAACRQRHIEAVLFDPGDELTSLASAAVRDGADALGMAGGDGSQAAVAAVAAAHDLPFVCVPAGTRNHLAFDLGIDRSDLVGALDAFVDGTERRIDLGRVNGRVFVNNVAMGVYGAVVQSPSYRDHKVRTTIDLLPELVGRQAEPFDLRFTSGLGVAWDSAVLVLVSNGPYELDPHPRRGNRGQLDRGVLGIVALGGRRRPVLEEWAAPRFRIDSSTTVALGVDGESVTMLPPLLFECDPKALTVRVPSSRVGRRGSVVGAGARSRSR
jgi:diacylglycerol kinase family enzyme